MFCCSSRDDGKNKAGQARTIETRNAHQQQHYDQYNQPRAPPGANIGQGQQQPQQTSGKPVGVGIVFQPDSTGALHVKSLAVNGPAEKSGQVASPPSRAMAMHRVARPQRTLGSRRAHAVRAAPRR
jgi:C-terminal processing protease CtpA/Prc